MSSPRAISACEATNGAAPITSGLRRASAAVARQSASAPPLGVGDLDVRDDREHAVADFLLEAVHHRQDDDQRGNAEGDAEHRDARDEGDEPVLAPGTAGTRVAPADLQFVGPVHAAAMLLDGSARAPRRAHGSRSDNRRMHLLVPFASGLSEACAQVLGEIALPHLGELLTTLAEADRDEGDAYSFSPPHERALAAAWGWHGGDGELPFAARAAAADGIATGDDAWVLLTPSHWQVGRDSVTLLDPALLALAEPASRSFFDAVRGLLESEGFACAWGAPDRWYAARPDLAGLATASLDRAIGRSVDLWLRDRAGDHPLFALVRRLQSEAQLLLHTHLDNEAREQRGELPVNSIWVSGCGRHQEADPARTPTVAADLRPALLVGDWAAWAAAWRALDAGPIAALLEQARAGAAATLTLCGERSALRLISRPRSRARSLWRRARSRWRDAPPGALLASL